MKERLQHHLSEVGESFDYLRSDIRNLSRYMAELEELIEHYRAFTTNAILSTPIDRAAKSKLLKKTQKVIGPPPSNQSHAVRMIPRQKPWRAHSTRQHNTGLRLRRES
jgi:hypothetical protein